MHITKIRYRNFCSIGNNFAEFVLDACKTTLLSGRNGGGKSSLIEAIIFALYGRSYRNVNKDRLINKVNKKDSVVEIEFKIGSKEYKVVRGQKPNIFEVYEDGSKLLLNGDLKEQQKYLEEVIMKISYKTFTQVVILGSANYVPFMQLDAADRRGMSDTLLQITVFTQMAKLLRTKISLLDQDLQKLESDMRLVDTKIEGQEKLIKRIREDSSSKIEAINEKIKLAKQELVILVVKLEENSTQLKSIQDKVAWSQKISNEVNNLIGDIKHTEQSLNRLRSVHILDSCNECKRPLDAQEVADHRERHAKSIQDAEDVLHKLNESLGEKHKLLEEFQPYITQHHELIEEDSLLKYRQRSKAAEGQALVLEKKALEGEKGDEMTEVAILNSLRDEKDRLYAQKLELTDTREIYATTALMLKDDGIKATIIKQYIPLFNQYVMKYLGLLNYNIKFSINEEYEDTIILNGTEDYPYNLLSMGERSRIDLAVLFAWRDIAMAKNSMVCNLLVMDEVLEAMIDDNGLEDLLTILNQSNKMSAILISHKPDQLTTYCDRHIIATKKGRFTSYQVT